MRPRHAVPGLLCSLFGLVFVIATAVNPQLSVGSTTFDGVPGAGFFPMLLGGLCVFLGLVLAVRGMLRRDAGRAAEADAVKDAGNQKRLVLCVLAIAAFLALWKLTGLYMAWTFLLCLFLNLLFGKSWRFGTIYAVVFTAFVYLVFSLGFEVQFIA